MPKRTDLETILVIGAGPIVIGQAAEFDYSGTQAIKALKAEGYRVVLVNSNPATIMTDPEIADATYVEPITVDILEAIIAQERPDALLPTVGGQTGLNSAVALAECGVLDRYGVQLIGAGVETMKLAEDRLLFKEAVEAAGLACPSSGLARSVDDGLAIAEQIGGYPLLIRPSFTLGGTGGGVAYNRDELIEKVKAGLQASPARSVLVEESVLGWKEFELEVMRDRADNFVVVCSIENVDPMGVHTGDSITVAPAMTLTDREYQRLRDQARTVMQVVGVETGGSNVQFAVNPEDGRVLVIEMNPRVSRSSALASKATGFPIAKLAALLAVGYTLDEIPNDITRTTLAAFEPSIDYVVTKIPRWAFEKFPGSDDTLGPQMKSVGEVMAIGRTFKESLLKGLQSLELSRSPFPTAGYAAWDGNLGSLARPHADRLWAAWEALRAGRTPEAVADAADYDYWFVMQLAGVVDLERALAAYDSLDAVPAELIRDAKRAGFGDPHIAYLLNLDDFPPQADPDERVTALDVRRSRLEAGIRPTYHVVDTCAAEFEAYTPYLYSAYETESEAPPTDRRKVVILGSGPNRIGQGIEFDYCCVHAAFALRDTHFEAIMVNCNPETVSTDYDTADRLYFEPLTLEHVLNIVEREEPEGVIVQFGGQTPLNLTKGLQAAGVPILGTSPDAIDIAEDRARFSALANQYEIPCPAHGSAISLAEALQIAHQVEYPVIVRPSYVLGGRAMAIVYDEVQLAEYVERAMEVTPGQAILVDHFLEDAFEVDVDAIADGEQVVIGAIMQHIEEAGVHSGDSACVIPPYKVSQYHLSHIREYTIQLGKALDVCGLMNIQYAVKDDVVYVLEVNPRASRTVPYVSKATGVPLARLATQVLIGSTLADLGLTREPTVDGFFVKEAVLPFKKLLSRDALLGPEMRSTGEVLGHATQFGHAFAKSQIAAGGDIPLEGTVFISVNDYDKSAGLKLARDLSRMGFRIVATPGTAEFIRRSSIPVATINKVDQGSPHIVEMIREDKIDMIINTPLGPSAQADGALMRTEAVRHGVLMITTLSAAQAAVNGIRALRSGALTVNSLQDLHRDER